MSGPRLIDCVMLGSEMDMLHCRLYEGFADLHVITEAAVTHRGDPKPLHFKDNAERFAEWGCKIARVVPDLPPQLDPWPREHRQRDAAMSALEALGLDGDDVILIADADEFPPRGFDFSQVRTAVAFDQRMAMYAVDWLYPEPHRCTVAARWGYIRESGQSLSALRDSRYGLPGTEGGWHLTWLGGLQAQRDKLSVTCHTEMTESEYDRIWSGACYEQGVHHGDGGLMMVAADVDSSWPKWISERKCPESWFRPRPQRAI